MDSCNYRNTIIVFALIIIFIAGCDGGSDFNSSSSLPATQLQSIVDQAVIDSQIPGAILGIQTTGETWIGAAGEADIDSGARMAPDMQVRLASVTKPLSAVLVMKLVEDGILSLDDTVENYLPGQVPGGDEMTLRMLLNHSAGVADANEHTKFWEEVYNDPASEWSSQDVFSFSMPETPVFSPGSAFRYSNTGYYLLGMIIEAATEKNASALFQEKIAGPADLTRTTLTRQGALEEPCTNGYAWLFTTQQVEATRNWNFSWDWTAGAGVSTAADMLRFADALFNGWILKPEAVASMTDPDSFAPGIAYGLGLGVMAADDPGNPFGERLIGWSGENPGTATLWYYLPDYDTSIFVAVNRNDIPEGPGKEPPVNGAATAFDIFSKAWKATKPLFSTQK